MYVSQRWRITNCILPIWPGVCVLQKGEVANRILSVGSEKRALMLSEYLEPPAPNRPLFIYESSRGFLTITGVCGGSHRQCIVYVCVWWRTMGGAGGGAYVYGLRWGGGSG